MKLNWIRSEPVVTRPIKDIDELFGPSDTHERGGIMGRDVETVLTVDRILAVREKYKKQASPK